MLRLIIGLSILGVTFYAGMRWERLCNFIENKIRNKKY